MRKDYLAFFISLFVSRLADQILLFIVPLIVFQTTNSVSWAGLFVLADLAMLFWQRNTRVNLPTFEQHQDLWLQPLRIAFRHIRQLAELQKIIVLAVGVNLLIGVTLATSAAMVIGQYAAGKQTYAGLQAAGALTTIAILFYLARSTLSLKVLGSLSYSMIACGALITALSPNIWAYTLGFLLITGFDKMFNIYFRSVRQKVIPPQDFGKTVGVVSLLNNLSQPLAGLLIALLAGPLGTQTVILWLTGLTALIGVTLVTLARRR